MISYAPFWQLMKKEKMSQYRLIRERKLSAGLLNRLRNNQPVSTESIKQILQCFRHYGVSHVRAFKANLGQGGSIRGYTAIR